MLDLCSPFEAESRAPVRQHHRYIISGFAFDSDLELYAATPVADRSSLPDMVICAGHVPERLPEPERAGEGWQCQGGMFLLKLQGIGRFLMLDGRTLCYQADLGADAGHLRLYLLGTCTTVLLLQRGTQVLHASAVQVGHAAALFCGPSGAGKSTLAALLDTRGYAVLNDDVCCLHKAVNGQAVAAADGRLLKLWQTTLDQFPSMPVGPAVHQDVSKYYCPPQRTVKTSLPVRVIYVLETTPAGTTPRLSRSTSFQAALALREQAFRPVLTSALDLHAQYFEMTMLLLQQATVYKLQRPCDFLVVDQTIELLEQHWRALHLLA